MQNNILYRSFLYYKVAFVSVKKNSAVQIHYFFRRDRKKALTIFFSFIIIYDTKHIFSLKILRRYIMATKKKVNVDDALETVEIVTETVTENVTENAENVTENVAESTTENAEIAADETPSVNPETVDETEKAKQPLSLEDALAAAEFAAGQYESFAAEEKAGKESDSPSEPEPAADELPEIGAATFDPSMFDEGEITMSETPAEPAEEPTVEAAETPVETAEIPVEESAPEAVPEVTESVESEAVPLPDLSEERPVMGGETPVEKVEKTEKQAAKKPSKPREKKAATAKKAAEESAPATEEKQEETPAEETPAAVTENEEQPVTEDKKVVAKKGKPDKKSKDKAADAKAEKPKKEELTLAQRSERLRAKLSPEKNFRLLKILIIVLSVICAAISAYVYIFVIYDKTTPFSIAKIVPIIPFIAQLLLLLITLLTAGTSKRRPIGAALKENMQIKQEVKEKEKDEKISKEISDHLLEPEVALNTTKRTVELSSFQIDNFYKKNIEEINGKYYMQVAKFDDSVKVFNALGATDMELCAVNMVGSAKFDEILNQPRTKTLSSQELATYFMSKPNVFTIKKRGALDWTFKYSSKSFGIIRENDDSYKVSIKCYPDAAQRINDVYKALEDSNFPSGPLWYCFNELRNLPPRVCKWLVDTSCQISQFQQIKTDKLKDTIKTAKDYDIDIDDIRTKFQAGEKVLKFPKFTMIFSKGNDADMTTYLTRECEGVDASAYTKEYYYKFADGVNSVSILCPTKGLSEDVIIAIFDEIEKIAK